MLAFGNYVGGIDQNIRYYPFCGVDIDAEIDPDSYKPTAFLKQVGQPGVEIKHTDIQLTADKERANTDIQPPPEIIEKEIAK